MNYIGIKNLKSISTIWEMLRMKLETQTTLMEILFSLPYKDKAFYRSDLSRVDIVFSKILFS